ncbi:hypothetical protein AAG906_039255 [Vitis piasezkii]
MDLMDPMRTESLGGKKYILVMVDDYSRNQTWFSAPKTPQQNGIVERKNCVLQEMARTRLNQHELPTHFWAKAINTAYYTSNRFTYSWKGMKPSVNYFRVFGSRCYVLKDHEILVNLSAFLNGILNEEVYMEQPKGFQDLKYPNHVYRLRKTLHGLKQAPRAWHEKLTSYLLKKGFLRTGLDRTFFIRRNDKVFLVVQIYVDDIMFAFISSNYALDFAKEMKSEYQACPKESHLIALKCIIRYIAGTLELGLWYPLDTHSMKSTLGGCFYIGNCLVAWMSKKQNSISLSIAKVEYIVVGSCCSQLIWIKQMLKDYGIDQGTMVVFYDNTSAINISKNGVLHSITKHIDIRHHFIRNLVEDKIVSLEYVPIKGQIVEIITKALDVPRFESLRRSISLSTLI